MRISVIGAATIALLSTSALVSAQQMQEPKGQPSAKEQGPAPGGKMGQSGSEKGAQRSNDGADSGKGPASSGDKGNRAQSGDRGGDSTGRAEKSDSRQDRKGSAQSDRGSDQRPDQRPDQRKGKAAETKGEAGDRKQDAARDSDRSDQQRDQAQQGKDGKRDQAQGKDGKKRDQARQGKDAQPGDQGQQGKDQAQNKEGQRDRDRVNLSQNQRGEVREKLSRHREARHTNVNFSINIGTRVPRDFRLQVIPTDIVSIVPAYRGYRYFIVNERVVIVHPTRYEIVEVIDVDGGPQRGGAVSASLDLSQDNIALILDRLPNRRPADVRVDLALGAEVPSSVDLYEFPPDIVAEIPSIRSYRYVVLDRSVLIVDPSGRDVVRVIDR